MVLYGFAHMNDMENTMENLSAMADDINMHTSRWVRDGYFPNNFDRAANELEKTHGVNAVWDMVREKIFETENDHIRNELIESYGNSPVSDEMKVSVLEKLLRDNSVGVSSKTKAMKELDDYVDYGGWTNFAENIYGSVNDDTKQLLFNSLMMSAFDKSGIRDKKTDRDIGVNLEKLVWLFSLAVTGYSMDELLKIVKERYVPKYGAAKVKQALCFITGHGYCTDSTHSYVQYALAGIDQ